MIALRETSRPLTAAEIRERVAGYGPNYGQADAEAFRRMFERDKADLRALGIPVETAPVDRHQFYGDDRAGYFIDPARYDLPPLDLRPAELAALAVAVQITGLADEAGSALRKLAVDAGAPEAASTPPPPLSLGLDTPHRGTLVEAQLTRTPVRFSYRPAGRAPAQRTVEPHALVHRRGRWYLVAFDRQRGERRAFRLDRIEGAVRPAGAAGAYAQPAAVDLDDVLPPAPPGAPETASLVVSAEVAWQVARSARGEGTPAPGGWLRYEVAVGDPDAFVGWVLELGDQVEVEGPEPLRRRVVAALERLTTPGPDRQQDGGA